MLRMEQVKDIKYLRERKGLSYRAIIKETGHAFETVKKYADQDDFNIEPKLRKRRQSKLEPYSDTIKAWLEQDLQVPRKQRHTAQRIYGRLKEISGDTFAVSDRAVRSKVAKLRKEMNNQNDAYLPLEHPPGEAQADFGEAVFVENGKRYQGHYLTLSFPYSNAGYTQLTRGENQKCLLTVLKDIFEYICLVPDTVWFDNLSTAVKRIKKYGMRDKTQGLIGKVILVADRGMISQELLTQIEQAGLAYIVGMRMRKLKTMAEVLSRPGRYQKVTENLKVKEVIYQNARYIVCFNHQEAKKDQLSREEMLITLARKLKGGPKKLAGNRGFRRFLKIQGAAVTIDPELVSQEARFDGKYVLTTNTAFTPSEVAQSYKSLWQVERAFRELKSGLKLRPVYHWNDARVQGHIMVCFLALILETALCRRLK